MTDKRPEPITTPRTDAADRVAFLRKHGSGYVPDAERVAEARRIQAEAMERAFPGCGPIDGSDL